jgi:MFS family permease
MAIGGMRWYDYITINIYWFALTARSQVLSPLIIPLLVQSFVGEAVKGAYVGQMRLWALMVAVLVQSLAGLISDRSRSPWGRRRPFIAVGAVGQVAILILIGFTVGMTGMAGYWVLFFLYILSMVSSDTAHAATQGLIPDLVPEDKRGLASGVKALFELPLPLVFVSFVVGRLVSAGNLWAALIVLMAVILVCALIAMLVREVPLVDKPPAIDWRPFLRLVLMTGVFTAIILITGALVKAVMQADLGLSDSGARLLTGVAGALGMIAAIVLGVVLSIRVAIGAQARQHPSFTWWVVNRLAFLVPAINLAGFVLFFLQERFVELGGEKAAGPAATASMFVGILILLTALPAGWLADRVGKRPVIVLSAVLSAVGTFVILAVPQLMAVYAGAGLIGAGAGLFYSANWALGTALVPKAQAARYLGISNLAGAGAGAIGAYIGGPIADELGYSFLFIIYGALFLLAGVTLLGVRERELVVL